LSFNSIDYLVFLPVVFVAYRLLSLRGQNLLLLAASYVFYGWWDERFLFLLVISTAIDYLGGLVIHWGYISRRERWTAWGSTILAAFLFVTIDWHPSEGSGAFDYQTGWWILACTVLCCAIGEITYPILQRLPEVRRRKVFLAISMTTNLALLGFFKYFNFFIESADAALKAIGLPASELTLNIILPAGISFYTFQTMSYTIDIYRGQLKPTRNFFDFALFVTYFPQLVAGPIERAARLLPALMTKRTVRFADIESGCFLILFGLFKKVGIADSLAPSVDSIFNSTGTVSALDVGVATVLFAVQIYCDFSGYSDIARGTSRLFGIELMANFNIPYFSTNPSEFWRRWHISLSSWLRDYLYIPLGGNRGTEAKTYRNLMITMGLGGLWHGAAWNFVIWGIYQGSILCIHRAISGKPQEREIRSIRDLSMKIAKIILFFLVTCYGWLLFRAGSLDQIISFTRILLTDWSTTEMTLHPPTFAGLLGIPLLFALDLLQYRNAGLGFLSRWHSAPRGFLISIMVVIILMGTSNAPVQFIYFQF
jgi:alginate O-acetyltransferase complex protein AlgI